MVILIISFLIACLMGMGVGGGGLFIIYLTLCLNFDQMSAQGTNLIFFIIAGVASLIFHFKFRKIYLPQLLVMIPLGAFGSYIFSHLSNTVSPHIPRLMLGLLLLGCGFTTLIKSFIKNKK